ncbi:MAG TPA: carboxyltransferase domain-containing protein [Candidatus Dietzia intestinipullorum]|nr:carboxyltransferase domain-containing protein [Candidatus Dietzia intestinipullorum]
MTTRIRPCGEAALLLECADLAGAVALARELERLRPDAVDVVPAARTVLVAAAGAQELPALRRRVEGIVDGAGREVGPGPGARPVAQEPGGGDGGRVHTLEVRYDGPDVSDVADLTGLPVAELVRRHTAVTWRAAFGGFAPGFSYLVDDRELGGPGSEAELSGQGSAAALPTVPRLGSPRTAVPAGSVGLADRFCAVYPGVSPGGWRLIGTTDAAMWDPARAEPALVAPGDRVRFVEAR